jgi:type VI secretion system secreted protein VgrG
MPDFKQAGRLMQFDTVLDTDKLLIDTFEGVEGISRLFDFQAELLADASEDIDPSSLIGTCWM